ncbi:hypothetical protein HOY80DRAFT_213264 [Tuber brumale]|nr:hypothetical protein HOY80DRAFT_213264 [Tuber brumale]
MKSSATYLIRSSRSLHLTFPSHTIIHMWKTLLARPLESNPPGTPPPVPKKNPKRELNVEPGENISPQTPPKNIQVWFGTHIVCSKEIAMGETLGIQLQIPKKKKNVRTREDITGIVYFLLCRFCYLPCLAIKNYGLAIMMGAMTLVLCE